ncbi:MAG: amidase [Acidobacteria bacterium]|nr:amidase [Acidobacteriota bacterium]
MLAEDVLYWSIGELASRLHSRELSAVDLVESFLARIDRIDPHLHAFVTVTRDVALAEAHRAEQEIRAGRYRGPLHGIPYGVKDLLATKGIPTTWGAPPLAKQIFDHDATVISKLREAGAILLGKLAMIELAGGLGYTIPGASATGATRNPWRTDRWTCGSSSGAGAAVASALVTFAIGSETWGSIVCPASFSGISGLRPTFGRISRYGAMPLSWSLDKLGPMARTAEDCEIVLQAIAGWDPKDTWSVNEPLALPAPAGDARRFKAGYLRAATLKGLEPGVARAYDTAVRALAASGMKVQEVTLPDLPFEAVANVFVACEATAAFDELFRDGRVRQLVDRDSPLAQAAARMVTGTDFVKASRVRALGQRMVADFFAEWDVLLAPGEPMTAFAADASFADLEWSDPVGAMGNLCGLPAIAVPCGWGKDNLPVGLTIVAGAFEDRKVLAAAKLYQETTDWHRAHPPATGV